MALVVMILTLGVPVTQRGRTHVTQPDCPLAAAVYKGVAVVGVELGCRDHLCELLHVGWLDVHDIWHRRVKEGPGDGGGAWVISSCACSGSLYDTQGHLIGRPLAEGQAVVISGSWGSGGLRKGVARSSEVELELRSEMGVVAHDSNYTTQEAEAGGLLYVQVQPGPRCETLSQGTYVSGSSS